MIHMVIEYLEGSRLTIFENISVYLVVRFHLTPGS